MRKRARRKSRGLNPPSRSPARCRSPIYIPLCFYFIGAELLGLILLYSIYIPLCFYFIIRRHVVGNRGAASTFHYASTLSVGRRSGRMFEKLSTFHYASTLSCTARAQALKCLYLHSIMLLLYPGGVNASYTSCYIYIPLCFYFI